MRHTVVVVHVRQKVPLLTVVVVTVVVTPPLEVVVLVELLLELLLELLEPLLELLPDELCLEVISAILSAPARATRSSSCSIFGQLCFTRNRSTPYTGCKDHDGEKDIELHHFESNRVMLRYSMFPSK